MQEEKIPKENPRIFDPYEGFRPLSMSIPIEAHGPPTTIIYSDPETEITNLMIDARSRKPSYYSKFAEVVDNTIVIGIDAARKHSSTINVSFGVWFSTPSLYNANGLLPKDISQTYQTGELYAVKTALGVFRDRIHSSPAFKGINRVLIMTESQYVVDSMSKDIWKWETNGYMTARKSPVVNSNILKELHGLIKGLEEKKIEVEFWMILKKYNHGARKLALDMLRGVEDQISKSKERKARKKKQKQKGRPKDTGISDTDVKDNAGGATPDEY